MEPVWQPCTCDHSRMIHGDLNFMDGLGACFTEGCSCKRFVPKKRSTD